MEIRYLFRATSVVILIVLLSNNRGLAQNVDGITSMHTYLQQHADSTIIFKYTSNWITARPEFKIISKKGDTITRYLYKFGNKPAKMPRTMRDTISKIHKPADMRNEFREFYKIGINKYFNVLYSNDEAIKTFWKEIQNLTPWNINDDSVEGEGCPPNEKGEKYEIYDGGGILLFLITKNEIKRLYFYAPQDYNERCPGKKGRETILDVEKIFNKYFN